MPLLQRTSVQATCGKCRTVFLVEGEAAGAACLCPNCGEDVLAPPAPLRLGMPAALGFAAAGMVVVGCGVWLAIGLAADPAAAPPVRPEDRGDVQAKVTYHPSTTLPELALQQPVRPVKPATPPGAGADSFSKASTPLLVAQAELPKVDAKQAEPKQGDPKQGDAKQGETPATVADAPEFKELVDAIAAFRRQDIVATRALLEQAAKAHPELPPVPFMLGELFLSANQVGLARQELEQAAAKFPRYAGSYLMFGNLALAEGRVTDAALELEKARSLEAEVSDPTRRKKIQVAIRMSLVSVGEQRQDWPAARDAAEEWLAFDPANARARTRLAKALLALDKPDEARRELERASADDKDQQPPEAAMAAFYTELGDLKSAETWLERALASHSKNFRVAMFAAAWMLERERAAEAQPLAIRAQELDPTSVDAKLLCALVARQQRNFREAEKWLELARRDAPASFPVANQLALVLAEQEDDLKRKRAIELAEATARQHPRSADAASTLGWAYYRGGRIEQAEQALQAAVSNGRASSDTAYFFAHVLAERGKLDAAARLLQDAVKANGPFAYRAEAKKWLERIKARPGLDPEAKEPGAKEPGKDAKEPAKTPAKK